MDKFKCSNCSHNTIRNYDLTRHLKRVHGISKNIVVPSNSPEEVRHLQAGMPMSEEPYPSMNSPEQIVDLQDKGHYGMLHQPRMEQEESEKCKDEQCLMT